MKSNISWVRVLSATQVLSAILFACVLFVILKCLPPSWGQNTNIDNNFSSKKEVSLLPQTHLSNDDDCVDVIVVKVCDQGSCNNYVNSFHVLCKELSGQD